jgi:hypothetical protein
MKARIELPSFDDLTECFEEPDGPIAPWTLQELNESADLQWARSGRSYSDEYRA